MSNLAVGEPAGKAGASGVRAVGWANQLCAIAAMHPQLRRASLATRLLALLADHAATTGRCWPSIHGLSARLGSWRDSIRRALRLLASLGFVAYTRTGQGTYTFTLPIDPTLRGARLATPGGRASHAEGGAPPGPELIRTEGDQLTGADLPAETDPDPSDAIVDRAIEAGTPEAINRAARVLAARWGTLSPGSLAGRLRAAVGDRGQARRVRRAAVHATMAERFGWAPEAIGARFGAVCQGLVLPYPVHPDSEAARVARGARPRV